MSTARSAARSRALRSSARLPGADVSSMIGGNRFENGQRRRHVRKTRAGGSGRRRTANDAPRANDGRRTRVLRPAIIQKKFDRKSLLAKVRKFSRQGFNHRAGAALGLGVDGLGQEFFSMLRFERSDVSRAPCYPNSLCGVPLLFQFFRPLPTRVFERPSVRPSVAGGRFPDSYRKSFSDRGHPRPIYFCPMPPRRVRNNRLFAVCGIITL